MENCDFKNKQGKNKNLGIWTDNVEHESIL